MTFPLVDVAVVLIVRRGQILTDYNPHWAAFTLPMSKQRDRHGVWKRYTFHVFALPGTEGVEPMEGHAAAWLTPEQFQTHRPVSPTAAHILSRLEPAELRRTLDG